ncbi:MAG TPA: hypothetical protein DCY05_07890 [Spirochaetaceae bacterium]|nr:hypothetical protein [Spirochaetaceae bacterium]
MVFTVYSISLLAILVAGFLRPIELTNISGPVVIRLGHPEGADEVNAVSEAVEPPPPAVEAPPEPETPPPAEITPPEPTTPPPTPQPTPVPVQPTTPVSAPPVRHVTPNTPAPTQPPTPPAPAPQPVVIARGEEAGNSYDLMVEGGAGVVSASGMIPINLFMPLPYELPLSLYEAIPDKLGLDNTAAERRTTFTRVYERTSLGWRLINNQQPDYNSRIQLWPILEDAHYDLANAEYKMDKNLRPVVVVFSILPASQGARLVDISLRSSSGYSDIDEAVLEALRRASFSNNSDRRISGTYTYRF